MENSEIKIVYFGTPEFSSIVLEELCQQGLKPLLAVTSKDKPVGRKQEITPSPVKIAAEKNNIPVFQPDSLKEAEEKIKTLAPDLIILAAYKKLIPREILDIPKKGCLNLHPSLLPRYRGASPVQAAILNGDKKTGLTLILMEERIDRGPIVSQKEVKIEDKITCPELSEILAKQGSKLLAETIPEWLEGKIEPEPQKEAEASCTKALKKEDGRIDWLRPASSIERQVRAFLPWPGTFCYLTGKKMEILEAEVLEQTRVGPFGAPGKTFLSPNEKIAVQTGKDFLVISRLQIEGKKPVFSKDFLRGNYHLIGEILK